MSRLSSNTKKISIYLLGSLCVFVIGLFAVAYFMLWASLPHVSGTKLLPGLSSTVTIERDALGIPTIRGKTRLDVARATGFTHAQDRFFQMDLLRRSAAGQLSELLGPKAIEIDKSRRIHGFRELVGVVYEQLPDEQRQLINAYAEGVNAGLQSLQARPFEYFLLSSKPTLWRPEDCLLIGYALFFDLQDSTGVYDLTRACLKESLPESVYAFFNKNGSFWEAPLDGSQTAMLPIPAPDHFAYLQGQPVGNDISMKEERTPQGGSNQWAISGKHTADGNPLVACDMHLRISVPNIWYRAAYLYQDENGKETSVYGVTLPGTPVMAVGSNRRIAWGYTNAYADTTDVVLIDVNPENPDEYQTPNGYIPFERISEVIKVRGQDPVVFDIVKTVWGPVLSQSFMGQPIALRWAAYEPDATNMGMYLMEKAGNVEEALRTIHSVKLPSLNFTVGDSQGNLGWSIVGYIPKRKGFDGQLPVSFADGSKGWEGPLPPAEYPSMINPSSGILWTANNRTVGDPWIGVVGNGGYHNAVRAYQIRQKLSQVDKAKPADMLALQLDDNAWYLTRWAKLLQEVLKSRSAQLDTRKQELLEIIATWDGKGSVDSAGYRFTKSFREFTARKVLGRVLRPCYEKWAGFDYENFDFEEPLWLIVSGKPAYLADPISGNWDDELLAVVDDVLAYQQKIAGGPQVPLKEMTWGKLNVLDVRHPLSAALPYFSFLLDMPKDPISGDSHMPKVSRPKSGASQRMVVSPGHEEEGIFHCPCGQSGNPLSPHYRDAHTAWLKGEASPFLPGPAIDRLVLQP
jgi:penicillin amidase